MGQTSKWWNSHNQEERLMMALHDNEMRIQQIKIDQGKAKAAYQKFLRDTNAQIKNCRLFIIRNTPTNGKDK